MKPIHEQLEAMGAVYASLIEMRGKVDVCRFCERHVGTGHHNRCIGFRIESYLNRLRADTIQRTLKTVAPKL